jgi:methylenetetrahydrofolate dehydrogenase (NADP+)/methenyltetrahydrofolate cyclohydrolase
MHKNMILLNGKEVSQKTIDALKSKISVYIDSGSRTPRLDIILAGEDFASKKYVDMKMKRAEGIGIKAVLHKFEKNVSTEEIVTEIKRLNSDNRVDGVMVQLPLPKEINTDLVLESIDCNKDVDGLTSINLGKLFKNNPSAIAPATAKGILKLLEEYEIEIDGSKAVVIGRSDIVGLPTAAVLQNSNATVTVCHSHSKNLKEICKQADILVVGIGKAEYIDKGYVKEGATVIDVGTNRGKDDKLVGDVKFGSVKKVAGYITPVPGGVGPMTISSLLLNLFEIYERNVKRY